MGRDDEDDFGNCASGLPVSSSKSMTGDTAGACGAIEAASTMMSLRNGAMTPTINDTRDPELDLDHVPNATLAFRKYAEGRPA